MKDIYGYDMHSINDLLSDKQKSILGDDKSFSRLKSKLMGEFETVEGRIEDTLQLDEQDGVFNGPVSDDDIVIMFDRMEDALTVQEAGYELGLAPGEINFDSSFKDGLKTKYALYIAGYVQYMRPNIIEALFSMIGYGVEEQDLMNEILARPMMDEEKGNPYHAAPDPNAPKGSTKRRGGYFTNKAQLAKDRSGSFSIPTKKKQRVDGVSQGGSPKFKLTKQNCGRAGRKAGKDVLCFTAQQIDRAKFRKLANLKREWLESLSEVSVADLMNL